MDRTTFPRLLLRHSVERPYAPALRYKKLGIWRTWTWREVANDVRDLALGLAALGFTHEEHLVLGSGNRPHLYLLFLAVQAMRGVPVPLYPDASPAEMGLVVQETSARIVFAEDQEQVDKFLELRADDNEQSVTQIIYDEPRGLRSYNISGLQSVHELRALGRQYGHVNPDLFRRLVAEVSPADTAVILYTSGTTSRPKGVCHTHKAYIAAAEGGMAMDGLNVNDNVLSYLPPAWAGDFLFSFAQWLVAGYTINCPESAETVSIDMREVGPTYYFAPPRIFEGMHTLVVTRMDDAGPMMRWLYRSFTAVALRVGIDILDGNSVPLIQRLLYGLGELLIYAPLKNVMGLSRIRVAYTAGAAIGPDLFRFFRSLGVNLKQIYGQTETCAYVCIQKDGQVKLDTVGPPAPGVELKITEDGEVLVRSASLLTEYYKRPEATGEVLDAEGFFHTGDAGTIDLDGHLKIIDRAADVGRLTGGAVFAPNYIENKLKFFPEIKEAVCFGHGREQVCAFLNIDFEAVGNLAERIGIPYAGYVDLAGKPEVLRMMRDCVARVNADLAREAGMEDTQVARFLVLHKELDPDDGELTRTRKVRRDFVADKYAVLIEALYGGKSEQYIETAVKFEDGRTGQVAAMLKILDAEIFSPVKMTV